MRLVANSVRRLHPGNRLLPREENEKIMLLISARRRGLCPVIESGISRTLTRRPTVEKLSGSKAVKKLWA